MSGRIPMILSRASVIAHQRGQSQSNLRNVRKVLRTVQWLTYSSNWTTLSWYVLLNRDSCWITWVIRLLGFDPVGQITLLYLQRKQTLKRSPQERWCPLTGLDSNDSSSNLAVLSFNESLYDTQLSESSRAIIMNDDHISYWHGEGLLLWTRLRHSLNSVRYSLRQWVQKWSKVVIRYLERLLKTNLEESGMNHLHCSTSVQVHSINVFQKSNVMVWLADPGHRLWDTSKA